MTDPFDALHEPVEPVAPDPTFAARLRERLARAVLDSPGGPTMTETTSATATAAQEAEHGDEPWGPSLAPYIVVADARQAMDWYIQVLGARPRGEPHVNSDGTIGHAEVALGDAVLMFAEASDLWPDVPVRAPERPSTFSHTLHLQVDDVDGTVDRARRRGATVEREPVDQPYGRGGVIVDPFGHRWMLLRPPPGATRLRQGDIVHITMMVPDDARAKAFYESVLGIEFSPGSMPRAWGAQTNPQLGMSGRDADETEVQLCYRVVNIEAAAERVRQAGGQAGEAQQKPYGLLAECTDDQGQHFQLWQP